MKPRAKTEDTIERKRERERERLIGNDPIRGCSPPKGNQDHDAAVALTAVCDDKDAAGAAAGVAD